MGSLFSYSLAASLVTLLLFPVMYLTVNRSTSFRFNRIILLAGMILSLALPLILSRIDLSLPASAVITGISVAGEASPGVAVTSSATESGFPWMAAIIALYFAGIIILSCREILSFIRLSNLIRKCEKKSHDGLTLCLLTDHSTAPFSWGNYIFLHENGFESASGCIYLHEKAHTEKRHWIDVILADLFCIVTWYNPFVWMTRQLVKLNHEFEADAEAIRCGIDTYDYQRLLVTKAMGGRALPLANSFAASTRNFRKRVLTMNRKRSKKKTMLIAASALPAIAIAWITLSSPVSANLLSTLSAYRFEKSTPSATKAETSLTGTIPAIAEPKPKKSADTIVVLPSPLKDQTALAELIRMSVSTLDFDKETKINVGIVLNKEGKVTEVVTDGTDNNLVKAVIDQAVNGVRFEQMTLNGQPIKVSFNIPVVIKK